MNLEKLNDLAFDITHKIGLECYSTPIQNDVLTVFLPNNNALKIPLNLNQLQSAKHPENIIKAKLADKLSKCDYTESAVSLIEDWRKHGNQIINEAESTNNPDDYTTLMWLEQMWEFNKKLPNIIQKLKANN